MVFYVNDGTRYLNLLAGSQAEHRADRFGSDRFMECAGADYQIEELMQEEYGWDNTVRVRQSKTATTARNYMIMK